MSWRDRAVKVDGGQPKADWRSRAEPVTAPAPQEQPSTLTSVYKNFIEPSFLKTPQEREQQYQNVVSTAKAAGGVAKDVAQSIKENPVSTAVGAGSVAGVSAGMALGPASLAATLPAAVTAQRYAQEADKWLGNKTGGLLGKQETPAEVGATEVSKWVRAVADTGLNLTAGALGKLIPAANLKRGISVLENRIAKAEATDAARAAADPVIQQAKKRLAQLRMSGSEIAKTLGPDELFSMNGQTFDKAAEVIKGSDWDRKTFAGALTAGKSSEFGSEANVLGAISGKLSPDNKNVVKSLLQNDEKTYSEVLVPKTNKYTDTSAVKEAFTSKLNTAKEALRKQQSANEMAVFTPKEANTPITASLLKSQLGADDVMAAMDAIGAGDKMANIMRSLEVAQGKPMTTKQLASVFATINKQFVTKDDDQARAVFYEKAYPKIKALMEQAAQGPTGQATKQYANAVNSYFDTRFGLSDLGNDFTKGILENKPQQVISALTTSEGVAQAQTVFDKFLDKGSFGDYVKAAIAKASKDPISGEISPAALNDTLSTINLELPEVQQLLGKEYISKLRSLQTVVNAEAIDGTKYTLKAMLRGESIDKARTTAKAVKDAVLNTAAGNSLGVGSAQATIGRNIAGALTQPSVLKSTVGQTSVNAFEQPANPLVSGAIAAGTTGVAKPALGGYTSQEEARTRIEKRIKELEAIGKGVSSTTPAGQGGPETTAPSMGPERNLDKMLGSENDPMGRLIQDAVAAQEDPIGQIIGQDDFDRLVRMQMMEEVPQIKQKLGTRQEEGFEPRVYRDTAGFKTVGIGFNMDAAGADKTWKDAGIKKSFADVKAGKQSLTKDEAEALFAATKTIAQKGAAKLVKNYTNLGEHQKEALIDMVFQLGESGAMAWADTRKLIEQGKFKEAADRMRASKNFKQTPNRVLRRAYMLQHNVSLEQANADLVKSGAIPKSASIA